MNLLGKSKPLHGGKPSLLGKATSKPTSGLTKKSAPSTPLTASKDKKKKKPLTSDDEKEEEDNDNMNHGEEEEDKNGESTWIVENDEDKQ